MISSLLAFVLGTASQVQEPWEKIVPFVEYEKTDIRVALSWLFQQVGVPYTFDRKVGGLVTVSLRNVPFEIALQRMTRLADATYRVQGGVFQVVPREIPFDPAPPLEDRSEIDRVYRSLHRLVAQGKGREVRALLGPKFKFHRYNAAPKFGAEAATEFIRTAKSGARYKVIADYNTNYGGLVYVTYGEGQETYGDEWHRADDGKWRFAARTTSPPHE